MGPSDRAALTTFLHPQSMGCQGNKLWQDEEGGTHDMGNCKHWGREVAQRRSGSCMFDCWSPQTLQMGFPSEIVFICGIQPYPLEHIQDDFPVYLEECEEDTSPGLWSGEPLDPGLGCRRQARMVLSWHCRVLSGGS